MIKTIASIIVLISSVLLEWGCLVPAQAREMQMSHIIEDLAAVTSATYKAMVVEKLQQEGKGAVADYKKKPGFVPTPKALMRRITLDIIKNNRAAERRFAFAPSDNGSPHFIARLQDQNLSTEEMAEVTAIAISQAVRAIRANYTGMVVNKLQKDGTGAALDYKTKQGFVPLPAVLIRRILGAKGFQAIPTALRSRWNLNEDQHLQDTFEHEGWDFLVKQQKTRLAAGGAFGNSYALLMKIQ